MNHSIENKEEKKAEDTLYELSNKEFGDIGAANNISENVEEKKGKINLQSFAVTFVLIVMVSIAAIQTFELLNIYNKINIGSIKATGASGVDSLPNMVGGC